jgi:hypothetical protein
MHDESSKKCMMSYVSPPNLHFAHRSFITRPVQSESVCVCVPLLFSNCTPLHPSILVACLCCLAACIRASVCVCVCVCILIVRFCILVACLCCLAACIRALLCVCVCVCVCPLKQTQCFNLTYPLLLVAHIVCAS